MLLLHTLWIYLLEFSLVILCRKSVGTPNLFGLTMSMVGNLKKGNSALLFILSEWCDRPDSKVEGAVNLAAKLIFK
jgi:hypothetical protein